MPRARNGTPVYEALNAPVRPATADAFRANIEALAQDCLARQGFSVSVFAEVMLTLPMTAGELAALYLGKNTLNVFRQAHGYKTGEYRKLWQGREDNVHLMEIMKDVDLSSQQVTEDIYVRLSARYETSSS